MVTTKGMAPGTMFNLAGYEPMAMIDSVNGTKIIVVSNNSTHFLLAAQTVEHFEQSVRESNMAEFVSAFPYFGDNDGDVNVAYQLVLTEAVKLAMSR